MIGWYVDIGYSNDFPVTLDNCVFLDNNVRFIIGTHYVEGILTTSEIDNVCDNPGEVASLLESVLGKDFYTWYNLKRTGYSLSTQETAVPSIFLMYPNTNKFFQENIVNTMCNIYYFKSLNMLVAYRGNSYHFYSVSGNVLTEKNIVNTSDSDATVINISKRNPLLTVFPNYKDGDNLSDSSKYLEINCVYPSSPPYGVKYKTFSAKSASIVTSLFTSNTQPDFTIIQPDNPYEPGGPSGPGGGDGSFDNNSDQIVDSSLPTISSANTGFTRIYNPSLSQVQALARYLWTDDSVIQTIWNHIKQYFEDPMQAIIGFNLVPVPVPNGGTQSFSLMYIDTGVEMTVAASQFVDVDCGTFELKEYYGSALDYSPNTKVSCFLPFIGTVSLNTDEVMGRTLQVKYRVDICSGSCVAKIGVDGNFIYQYSGHCAINIPISSADFSSYVSSAISVAQLAAGAIAAGAGGVMAPTAVDATQQTNQVVTTTQITNTARNPATGRQITTGTMTRVETRESPNDQSSTQASFSGITPQNISNTVGQIMSSKPNINHSGSFSGNSGYLGVRRPFLIIERPNMCMPSNFQALNGFPSMITLELSSCKGFTRVQQVQLTGFCATNPEQAEILQLLKSGVIL